MPFEPLALCSITIQNLVWLVFGTQSFLWKQEYIKNQVEEQDEQDEEEDEQEEEKDEEDEQEEEEDEQEEEEEDEQE